MFLGILAPGFDHFSQSNDARLQSRGDRDRTQRQWRKGEPEWRATSVITVLVISRFGKKRQRFAKTVRMPVRDGFEKERWMRIPRWL